MTNHTRFRKGAIGAGLLGMIVLGVSFSSGSGGRVDALAKGGNSGDRDEQLVGRQGDGSVVVTTNQILTPAGRHVEFRGRPLGVSLSPDGRTAAFLNGAYQAIILVDVETWTVKQEFSAAGGSASFTGVLYSAAGDKLYASQPGRVMVANVSASGTLTLNRFITTLPKSTFLFPGREDGDPYPGGLALSEDGNRLYVVLNRNNSVAVVELATDRMLAEIPVGNAPHGILISGDRAYVSNQGGRTAGAADFTNDSSGTPIVADPVSGVPRLAAYRSSISRARV